jgi:hypothetical protein
MRPSIESSELKNEYEYLLFECEKEIKRRRYFIIFYFFGERTVLTKQKSLFSLGY